MKRYEAKLEWRMLNQTRRIQICHLEIQNAFFMVFFSFVLYGPLQPPELRMSLLEEGENFFDNDKSSSRSTARKNEREEKTASQKNYEELDDELDVKPAAKHPRQGKAKFKGKKFNTTGYNDENVPPALTYNQTMTTHTLQVKKETLLNEKQTTLISGFTAKKDLLEFTIQMAKESALRHCPVFDELNYHWQQLEKLQNELPALIVEINEIMNPSKKITTADACTTDVTALSNISNITFSGCNENFIGVPGVITTSTNVHDKETETEDSDSILQNDAISGLCGLQKDV